MATTKLAPSVRCRDCQKLSINGKDFRCLETSMQIPQAEVNDRMYCTYFNKKDKAPKENRGIYVRGEDDR